MDVDVASPCLSETEVLTTLAGQPSADAAPSGDREGINTWSTCIQTDMLGKDFAVALMLPQSSYQVDCKHAAHYAWQIFFI